MTSREDFEKWFLENYEGPLERHGQWHEDEQRYTRYSILQRAWEIWQASRAALLEEIKAGHALLSLGEKFYRLPEGE